MWKEIHEALGVLALTLLTATALGGGVIHQFKQLRGVLPLERRTLVKLHRYAAVAFLGVALLHYLLARHVHPLQVAGVAGAAVVFALGWSLRLSKRAYRQVVLAKVAVLAVAALALGAGHLLVEDDGERAGEHTQLETVHRAGPPPAATFPAPARPDRA